MTKTKKVKLFDQNGIHSKPQKVKSIKNLPEHNNKKDIQHNLGHIAYMYFFIPTVSSKTTDLRNFRGKDIAL